MCIRDRIVDYLNGVIGSKGGYGSTKHKGHCHNSHTVIAEAFLNPVSYTHLEAGTPFHTHIKAIPTPIRLTALISELCQSDLHNRLVTAA